METARAEHGGLATSWDKRHKKEEERNTPVLAQICRLATVIVISALNPAHSHNTKSVIASAAVGIGSASWRDAMTMKWRIGIQSVLRAGEATIQQWERNRRRSSFHPPPPPKKNLNRILSSVFQIQHFSVRWRNNGTMMLHVGMLLTLTS